MKNSPSLVRRAGGYEYRIQTNLMLSPSGDEGCYLSLPIHPGSPPFNFFFIA